MVSLAGFFCELTGKGESIQSHRSLVGACDSQKVAGYLADGIMFYAVMAAEQDVLSDAENFIPGAPSLLTDGEWVWRSDYSYYVGKYGIAVPETFLARIRALNYQVPSIDDANLERIFEEVKTTL